MQFTSGCEKNSSSPLPLYVFGASVREACLPLPDFCRTKKLQGVSHLAKEKAACESQASVAGDARTWVAGALASSVRTTEEKWGRVEAAEPNQIWQTDMTKIWASAAVG